MDDSYKESLADFGLIKFSLIEWNVALDIAQHFCHYILSAIYYNFRDIYNTKGRDRFHWAATPLKPYKVGNICDMTYKCSVLYFLNLPLEQSFFHRKRQFLRKYPNSETVIDPCLIGFAHAQYVQVN